MCELQSILETWPGAMFGYLCDSEVLVFSDNTDSRGVTHIKGQMKKFPRLAIARHDPPATEL